MKRDGRYQFNRLITVVGISVQKKYDDRCEPPRTDGGKLIWHIKDNI